MVFHSEIQMKVGQETGHVGQCRAPNVRLPVSRPGGRHLVAAVHDIIHHVLPTGDAHLSLGVRSFCWDTIAQAWLPTSVAGLDPGPSGG